MLGIVQRIVQTIAFVVLACFMVNWVVSQVEHWRIERDLSSNSHIAYTDVSGVRMMYRCIDNAKDAIPTTATVWLVSGVGSSWLINMPPLWLTHLQANGWEFCAYARPGFSFTNGIANATDVDGTVDDVLALIEGLTPPTRKLVLLGHSYGGAIATMVARELRNDAKRRLDGLILLDAMPFVDPTPEQMPQCVADSGTIIDSLKRLAGTAEIGALLGAVRLGMAFNAIPRFNEALESTLLM
jgi:pimeloyl-ACP methyl ester carboxylesterase